MPASRFFRCPSLSLSPSSHITRKRRRNADEGRVERSRRSRCIGSDTHGLPVPEGAGEQAREERVSVESMGGGEASGGEGGSALPPSTPVGDEACEEGHLGRADGEDEKGGRPREDETCATSSELRLR